QANGAVDHHHRSPARAVNLPKRIGKSDFQDEAVTPLYFFPSTRTGARSYQIQGLRGQLKIREANTVKQISLSKDAIERGREALAEQGIGVVPPWRRRLQGIGAGGGQAVEDFLSQSYFHSRCGAGGRGAQVGE